MAAGAEDELGRLDELRIAGEGGTAGRILPVPDEYACALFHDCAGVAEAQQLFADWMGERSAEGEEEIRILRSGRDRVQKRRVGPAVDGKAVSPCRWRSDVHAREAVDGEVSLVIHECLVRIRSNQWMTPQLCHERIMRMLLEVDEQDRVGFARVVLQVMPTDSIHLCEAGE